TTWAALAPCLCAARPRSRCQTADERRCGTPTTCEGCGRCAGEGAAGLGPPACASAIATPAPTLALSPIALAVAAVVFAVSVVAAVFIALHLASTPVPGFAPAVRASAPAASGAASTGVSDLSSARRA